MGWTSSSLGHWSSVHHDPSRHGSVSGDHMVTGRRLGLEGVDLLSWDAPRTSRRARPGAKPGVGRRNRLEKRGWRLDPPTFPSPSRGRQDLNQARVQQQLAALQVFRPNAELGLKERGLRAPDFRHRRLTFRSSVASQEALRSSPATSRTLIPHKSVRCSLPAPAAPPQRSSSTTEEEWLEKHGQPRALDS